MKTVPASVACVLLADQPEMLEQVRACGREVGLRTEVDLDQVASTVGSHVAAALEKLYCDTLDLWADLVTGARGRAYIVTRSTIAEHTQVTSKVGRSDLGAVFDELADVNELRDVLLELTAPNVDEVALAGAVHLAGGSTWSAEDGAVTARVPLGSVVSEALGGVRRTCQVSRFVEVTARHAAWRDRRVRRLAKVVVVNEEMWASPDPARLLLAA